MNPTWSKNLPPFVLIVLATLSVVWVGPALGLEAWSASSPGEGWWTAAFVGYLVAFLLALTTYPVLRDAKLYAWTVLLLPVGLVQVCLDVRIWESHPEWTSWLPDLARVRFPGAVAFSLVVPALAVLCASPLPRGVPRPQLRRFTGLLLLVVLALGYAWLRFTPGQPLHPDVRAWAAPVWLGLPWLSAGLALWLWRSEGGAGGAVAGILVASWFLCVSALPEGGLPRGVDMLQARLPEATQRTLMHAMPVLLSLAWLLEWVLNLAHRTQVDALTRIYNKAYADSILSQTSSVSFGPRYSVALVDIDHFKKVNDTHGHSAGDTVLHEIAQAIQRTIGSRGVVCRTGGEEITVFFTGLELPAAQEACEEVREHVEGITIPAHNNKGKKIKINCTLSIGVASNFSKKGKKQHTTVHAVTEAADRAVYSAKRRGRNQVVVGR